VSLRFATVVLLAAFGGGACRADATECQEPVEGYDGGAFRCIKPEDCPRRSNELVCTSTGSYVQDCVNCVNTICVRVIAERCP
jgi:hypothetical protein